jgi:hypothetical protein
MRDRIGADPIAPPQFIRPAPALAVPPAPVVRIFPATSPQTAPPPRDPMQAREQSATIAAAPPRVQVTIGRLEIRAATAQPAPPRRQAKPTPAMSLDDYLTDRGKG